MTNFLELGTSLKNCIVERITCHEREIGGLQFLHALASFCQLSWLRLVSIAGAFFAARAFWACVMLRAATLGRALSISIGRLRAAS